jgi:hypothetical protein
MVTNLIESEYLIVMKYLFTKETDNYFIYDFTSILVRSDLVSDMFGPFVDFRAAEWMGNYHWLRSEVVNLSQDPSYLQFVRDYKINQIDTNDPLSTTRIELLRVESHLIKNQSKIIHKTDYDKSIKLNFKEGDKVWFNREPGIITYKHRGKEIKFTVRVKDTYTKYVPYNMLTPRQTKDYSSVKIPQEIKKLTTQQLLNKRRNGYLSDVVKAELQNREHIKRKTKIKEYGK